MSAFDDSDRLVAALLELPSRQAALLELRFVDGKSDAEISKLYGMSDDAYRVHLLRAARALTAAYMPVWGKAERDVSYESELAEAELLVTALAGPSGGDAAVGGPAKTVRHLAANAPAVRRKLDQAAAVEAASPAAQREIWIRRALVVVLLAVTAVLYFTRNH